MKLLSTLILFCISSMVYATPPFEIKKESSHYQHVQIADTDYVVELPRNVYIADFASNAEKTTWILRLMIKREELSNGSDYYGCMSLIKSEENEASWKIDFHLIEPKISAVVGSKTWMSEIHSLRDINRVIIKVGVSRKVDENRTELDYSWQLWDFENEILIEHLEDSKPFEKLTKPPQNWG